MKKYINLFNKECYHGVDQCSVFSGELFHMPKYQYEDDKSYALHTNLGSITVLDRVTGFIGSPRDIKTGYRDKNGNFWLASGGYDVRDSGCETMGAAIKWVKDRANTCVPEVGYE